MITVENLTKTYPSHGSAVIAVDDVSLHVPQGQILGVIGSSGAGKSSLIRCVNLLERPEKGRVLLDGVELTQQNAAQLRDSRRQMGMIFQHFNLLSTRTVFDNVALPLELAGLTPAEIARRVHPLLELTGLRERSAYYPAQLSGGQKQRVAIARALASEPKVLLCDEATSALDPQTTSSILKLLKNINQRLGLTILLITHEMDVIKTLCDQVAIMANGKVIEQGSVLDVFRAPATEQGKTFVRSALERDTPAMRNLQSQEAGAFSALLRLGFTGSASQKRLLTDMSARWPGVTFTIESSQLEQVQGQLIGSMVGLLGGEKTVRQEALCWIQKQIDCEVLGYVARED
ncbi:methionine ABC transporter ATP-binding protein [Pokkaliibacter sp. CJK22405]|uniref:methionine ABC transporter ATP-binding protein n=1 Tax=Pokkaliibacter sp. CJK22405 TaxID=3384615 RepID=UPI00398474DA